MITTMKVGLIPIKHPPTVFNLTYNYVIITRQSKGCVIIRSPYLSVPLNKISSFLFIIPLCWND